MLNESVSFLVQNLSDPFVISFILGALPVSEVRGAAIYAFSINNPSLIFPAIISNIIICPLILLFWKTLKIQKIGEFIFGKSLDSKLHKFAKSYETQGILALIIFIGLPFPATGVYTGTFLAELLGIKRSKILLGSIIGVFLSAAVMYILLSNLFSLFV
ncbi:MAG: small multi-drug export protein [Candidatus Micrarchaeia archaeon]